MIPCHDCGSGILLLIGCTSSETSRGAVTLYSIHFYAPLKSMFIVSAAMFLTMELNVLFMVAP